MSPAELMFGRRLRSRSDFLWPTDTVSARVVEHQQAQRKGHIGNPRTITFLPEKPLTLNLLSVCNDILRLAASTHGRLLRHIPFFPSNVVSVSSVSEKSRLLA